MPFIKAGEFLVPRRCVPCGGPKCGGASTKFGFCCGDAAWEEGVEEEGCACVAGFVALSRSFGLGVNAFIRFEI
jgi:hypothetical protein